MGNVVSRVLGFDSHRLRYLIRKLLNHVPSCRVGLDQQAALRFNGIKTSGRAFTQRSSYYYYWEADITCIVLFFSVLQCTAFTLSDSWWAVLSELDSMESVSSKKPDVYSKLQSTELISYVINNNLNKDYFIVSIIYQFKCFATVVPASQVGESLLLQLFGFNNCCYCSHFV